jgi:WD40 repeat protein
MTVQARATGAATPWRYSAFLSYSRAVDGKLAPALQQSLHRFAKPWFRQRAVRVFRDDASLSANPGLWSSIQAALDGSEFFILLASPEAAASPWVAREVEYWLAHKPPRNLLIAVTDGDVVWDAARGDFDRGATTCLPTVLFGALAEEPRWVDFRGARDEEHLSLRTLPFRDVVADLAAPLHHRDKDDMLGEDVRQHRRTIRLARSGATALAVATVVAVAAAIAAVNQARTATEQRNAAVTQQRIATARQLVASAANAVGGDPALALRLGLAARAINDDQEARSGLVDTLLATRFIGYTQITRDRTAAAAFSPDGAAMTVAVGDQIAVLDVRRPAAADRESLDRFGGEHPLLALGYAPDGAALAVLSARRLSLWRPSGYRLERLGSIEPDFGALEVFAFAAGGRTLAVNDSQEVALWDVTDPARPVRLGSVPAPGPWRPASLAAAGTTLAVAYQDGTVAVWEIADPSRPRRIGTMAGSRTGQAAPRVVGFVGANATLVVGQDRGLDVWDVSGTGPMRQLTRLAAAAPVHRLVSAGNRLASATVDGSVTLWDVTEPARPRRVDAWAASIGAVQAMTMTADGTMLATSGPRGGVMFWDARDRPRRVTDVAPSGHGGPVRSLAYLAGGAAVVSVGGDETLSLWDLSDPARPRRSAQVREEGNEGFHAVAASPDGTILVTGAADGTIAVWDTSDQGGPARRSSQAAGIRAVTSVGFAPDGKTAVAASGNSVTLLDVSDPARPVEADGGLGTGRVFAVAFSPDGATLAAGGDTGVELWNTSDATRLHLRDSEHWVAGATVSSLAFSPTAPTLAAGLGERGTVVLLDVTDPTHIRELGLPLAGGAGAVESVAFAPDGHTLAVGDSLGLLRLWDLANRDQPRRLGPPVDLGAGGVGTLAFAPAGDRLAAGGTDGTVLLMDVSEVYATRDDAAERACTLADGGFNRDDWAIYVPDLPYLPTCP